MDFGNKTFVTSSDFLHNILKREPSALMKCVYIAQKANPTKGDWIHIIEEDMELFNLNMNETDISTMSKNQFKNM